MPGPGMRGTQVVSQEKQKIFGEEETVSDQMLGGTASHI